MSHYAIKFDNQYLSSDIYLMSSILHILNGDSTAYSFKDTGLDGDILVWREVLSQGPLIEDISSAKFWEKRSEWISKSFDETRENYRKKVIEPLGKLSNIYEEITLWFEPRSYRILNENPYPQNRLLVVLYPMNGDWNPYWYP